MRRVNGGGKLGLRAQLEAETWAVYPRRARTPGPFLLICLRKVPRVARRDEVREGLSSPRYTGPRGGERARRGSQAMQGHRRGPSEEAPAPALRSRTPGAPGPSEAERRPHPAAGRAATLLRPCWSGHRGERGRCGQPFAAGALVSSGFHGEFESLGPR